MELLSKLGIDWRLFLAQLGNFLILFFILHRLLYKPVLKMLQERTEKIEKGLSGARRIEEQLKLTEEERAKKIAETRHEAQIIIEEAKKSAEKVKQEVVEATKKESAAIVAAGKEQLAAEQTAALKAARQEISSLVIQATKQVLKDVVDEKLDQAITESVIKKFK